jgi:dolichol-phosphate mannosyltransferase
MTKLISIVVPCFNEQEVFVETNRRLKAVMSQLPIEQYQYEIIYVNDGSTDQTLSLIKQALTEDKHLKCLSFSRNFGHQIAITAGLDACKGDAAVVIDADLQDPPSIILEMINLWEKGYDVVFGKRKDRVGESSFKLLTAKYFYKIINRLSDVDIPRDTGDFRLMDRKVVSELKKINDQELFFRGIIPSLGFRQTPVYFEPNQRFSGSTKYSMKKMVKLAITGIVSTSVKPLYFSIYIGAIMALLAFMYGIYAIYIAVFTDKAIAGWTSTLVSVVFIGGVQLMVMGIIGLYIGKVFINSKGRPNYIVDETNI